MWSVEDGQTLLVVLHTFADAPKKVQAPLPGGDWVIQDFETTKYVRVGVTPF